MNQLLGDKLSLKLFTVLRQRAGREPLFRGIVVPVDDLIGHYIMATGRFETTQFDGVDAILSQSGLASRARSGRFVDVGANIGLYSLALADRFASTLAIEANPDTFLVLTANLALRNKENITPLCIGASNTAAAIEIHVPVNGNLGQATLDPSHHTIPTRALRTSTLPLDRILKRNPGAPVALLKIDVEGHEERVLQGASETLMRDGPVVLFEVLSAASGTACATLLRDHGYPYFYKFKRDWPGASNRLTRVWRGLRCGLPVLIQEVDTKCLTKAALICASKSPLV